VQMKETSLEVSEDCGVDNSGSLSNQSIRK
jgi:hypothetical protein